MKKKILIALMLFAVVCANYCISYTTDKFSVLFSFGDVEAMAVTETACMGDPGRNTGKCKKQSGPSMMGASCVSPGFWDDKDCYDTVIIEQ